MKKIKEYVVLCKRIIYEYINIQIYNLNYLYKYKVMIHNNF